jgi:hypothetical protein
MPQLVDPFADVPEYRIARSRRTMRVERGAFAHASRVCAAIATPLPIPTLVTMADAPHSVTEGQGRVA